MRRAPPEATLKEIGDLVDRAGSRALLVRESLRELTAIVLALRFKGDKITHEDAAVTSNTMRHDLTSIQELVQVRAAESESLGGLIGRHRCGVVKDCDLIAITEASTELCVGFDPFHVDASLMDAVAAAFDGWEIAFNEPFHGAYVPLHHYQRDARVRAVMLEIRRDMYMRDGVVDDAAVDDISRRIARLVTLCG